MDCARVGPDPCEHPLESLVILVIQHSDRLSRRSSCASAQIGKSPVRLHMGSGPEHCGLLPVEAGLESVLFGLFGGGPLSRAEAITPSGALAVHYERFLHNDTPTTLRLRPGTAQADGWRWISLSQDYVDRVAIERVIPAPGRTVVTGRGLRLGFAPVTAEDAGEISIALTPIQAGIVHGELSAGSGPGVTFTQLVYP
jgi:hypothetical protein